MKLPWIARTSERLEKVRTAGNTGNGTEPAAPKEEREKQLATDISIVERCRC